MKTVKTTTFTGGI